MKPNRNSSAGAKADSSTKVEDTSVSQTIAKPNVGGWVCRVQRSRTQKQVSPNGLPIIYVGGFVCLVVLALPPTHILPQFNKFNDNVNQ